jgi:hypothetical protein
MMKLLKELKYVLLISAIILVMMVIKISKNNSWHGNTWEAAEIMALRTNFISMEEMSKLEGQITLIRTGSSVADSRLSSFPAVNAAWEEMVKKEFLRKITQPDHTYVIVSGKKTDGIRAWVLLDQMGVKNLLILDEEGIDNELFKYQFQPDTTVRLELENTDER